MSVTVTDILQLLFLGSVHV